RPVGTGQARGAIGERLLQCGRTEKRWCMSDLLWIKGEIALLDAAREGVTVAEQAFVEGLNWARRQHALSWELRSATSLARLRRNQGRIADARELLASVYDRFTEGFGTTDLRAPKKLLDQPSHVPTLRP